MDAEEAARALEDDDDEEQQQGSDEGGEEDGEQQQGSDRGDDEEDEEGEGEEEGSKKSIEDSSEEEEGGEDDAYDMVSKLVLRQGSLQSRYTSVASAVVSHVRAAWVCRHAWIGVVQHLSMPDKRHGMQVLLHSSKLIDTPAMFRSWVLCVGCPQAAVHMFMNARGDGFIATEEGEDGEEGEDSEAARRRRKKKRHHRRQLALDEEDYDLLEENQVKAVALLTTGAVDCGHWRQWALVAVGAGAVWKNVHMHAMPYTVALLQGKNLGCLRGNGSSDGLVPGVEKRFPTGPDREKTGTFDEEDMGVNGARTNTCRLYGNHV
eukprot:1160261-Pelagomonas_calceolata.AAC.1